MTDTSFIAWTSSRRIVPRAIPDSLLHLTGTEMGIVGQLGAQDR